MAVSKIVFETAPLFIAISLVVFSGHITALAKLGGRDSLVIGEKLQKGFVIGKAEISASLIFLFLFILKEVRLLL